MRISDWSSDVCSSDLRQHPLRVELATTGRIGILRLGAVHQTSQRPQQDLVGRQFQQPALRTGGRLPRHQRRLRVGILQILEDDRRIRSEEHTSEFQSLMRNSYAVFCLKKKKM